MSESAASPFCHIVIPAPDLGKAAAFYRKVFGWRVQERVPGEKYWFFESGNVGGAFDGNARPAENSVVLVVRVDDIANCLKLVAELGGVVTQPRSAIGDASPGYDAYFRDPNGNRMGVFSES